MGGAVDVSGGGDDTSMVETGGVSGGGVMSMGELVGEVTQGYFFLAKSLVAR